MFRDLKEYQNLQKLYEEKVSKVENLVEKVNDPGSGVKSNVITKIDDKKVSTNGNNKKIDTSFDSSKIANDLLDKNKKVEVKSGPDLNAMSKYSNNNRREVTMKDFTPSKETEIKKNVEVEKKPLTNREKFDKKFIRDPKTKTLKRRGSVTARRAENLEKNRLRAQAMAKARIEAKKKAQQEANNKENIKSSYEYDAYDLVLEYLLTSEQVATIEEANYVMTEMDAETIQGIVEEQKKNLDEKFGGLGKITLGQIGSTLTKGALGYGAYKLAFGGGKGNNTDTDTNTKTDAPNVTVDKKKKGNFFTNFINKKRDESSLGGNNRVEKTRNNSGDEKVGEKIYFK